FAPRDRPDETVGELWAIVFDGGRVRASKQVVPIDRCSFAHAGLAVSVGDAKLDDGALAGGTDRISWSLTYRGDDPPLLLLREGMYDGGFPKAKSVIPAPLVRFSGSIVVDGERIVVDDWLGSQNHNWGARHTDRYAWAQVAGFDGRDDAMLECITAKLKLGPLWTPWLTIAVLRVGDRTHAFNSLARAPFCNARIEGLRSSFTASNGSARLHVEVEAPREAFVGLRYANPPGGAKICLNTKIARARVQLDDLVLETSNRAALELLSEDDQGIPVVV
ncbi:MAG TPA: hypothetical protein VG755_30090, partial [Nannocystaceae bacterium]|nr:hypothetical protein [Nannocystaceae bacterium]